ncbi:MAG: RNA polymerase sigma factor [Clostridia bacterium]|nr:RNA polymerase sigma factor [Clostridia bacterium]
MDKALCDSLILEYTSKLYGFAVNKTNSIERAEELASRITLEVYASLLRRDSVANIPAYIYRIAENVWARFCDESHRTSWCDICDFDLTDGSDFTERIMESETYAKLRVEIAHLSKIRREILMLHYYDSMKLADIAAKLKIPLGTVKWHISGAKSELKEGMDTMRNIGKLGLAPIEFTNMGHDGQPGKKGDTSSFLERRLTQNIAYAAYHNARSINEIADELGVSPVFVADEVAILEEYGFMDKVSGDKYLTNILIYEPSRELAEKEHGIFCRYAKKVRELYVPRLIEALHGYDRTNIYIPENDENLLLWSGIAYALCSDRLCSNNRSDAYKYAVPRKDGGNYIAFAELAASFDISFDARKYSCCGNMTRGSDKYPVRAWQIGTNYDTRNGGWSDNLYTDYEYLYEFYTGKIEKSAENIEKYERLHKRGLLTSDDKVNIVCIIGGKEWMNQNNFTKSLPMGGSEMDALRDALAEELSSLHAPMTPPHMLPLRREYIKNSLLSNSVRMRVLELLVADGTLTVPTGEAAAGLNTLMFADVIPE